jgi:hypothetical protein
MSGAARIVLLAALVITLSLWASPPRASALSPTGIACSLTGFVSGAAGKLCTVATHAGRVLSAGKKLAGGHLGGAIGALTGSGGVKRAVTTAVGLAAIATAVVGGARYALKATAKVINATTSPNLRSTWFSAFYWRMAAVSALLTLPFLFAAAIQAMIRSDLGLLARSVFGYLPLGLLGVGIAAPLAMLLLAGSDEMSAIVSSASGNAGAHFLDQAGALAGGISAVSGDLFVLFFVGLLTAAATITLWLELLIRQAAVYVIVLMLPLFFAALVWPARRIWAARSVELLVALILSKFAIVSVLALGGAALGHTTLPGPASMLTGATLVLLAACTPWALLRLLPLHELAGAAAGGLSAGRHGVIPSLDRAEGGSGTVEQLAEELSVRMPQLMRGGSDSGSADGGQADLSETESDAGPGRAGGGGSGAVSESPATAGGSAPGNAAPGNAAPVAPGGSGGAGASREAPVAAEGAGGDRPPVDGIFAAGRRWPTLELSEADDSRGALQLDPDPNPGLDPELQGGLEPRLEPEPEPRLELDPDPELDRGLDTGLDGGFDE